MDLSHYLVELTNSYFRARNKLRRKLLNVNEFSSDSRLSDSQVSFYVDQIKEMLNSREKFERFRRNYDYREILEHVDFKLGKKYLEQIILELPENWSETIALNKRNDLFGSPYVFNYSNIGLISPTTLRYIWTAIDIHKTLIIEPQDSIVEVGIGYGGQSAVIERMYGIEQITVFDLPEVQDLARLYLSEIGSTMEHVDGTKDSEKNWDLLISNYAFSELPKKVQIWYLDNVLTKSRKGYMIMNSGRTNKSGRSEGKLSFEEIKEYIPNLEVKDENPKSGPDNYVVFWKNS